MAQQGRSMSSGSEHKISPEINTNSPVTPSESSKRKRSASSEEDHNVDSAASPSKSQKLAHGILWGWRLLVREPEEPRTYAAGKQHAPDLPNLALEHEVPLRLQFIKMLDDHTQHEFLRQYQACPGISAEEVSYSPELRNVHHFVWTRFYAAWFKEAGCACEWTDCICAAYWGRKYAEYVMKDWFPGFEMEFVKFTGWLAENVQWQVTETESEGLTISEEE